MPQRTWFITGVTSGFGRLMAEQLLARGDRVAGTTRRPKELLALQDQYPERFWLGELELSDAEACRRVVDAAFQQLGCIDVVVSNAGYGLVGAAEELSDDQIHRQVEINLLGSMRLIRAALPHLRRQGGGRVLQVSSTGGQVAFPMFSVYHATKWGIEGFVEALSQEVAPFGIEFTLVEPGGTQTGFSDAAVYAPAMDEYADTAVGAMRRTLATTGFPRPGDAGKVVQAMIRSVDQHPAPKRLPLGSDTYKLVRAALTERLAALEAQKGLALAADTHPPTEP